MAFCGLRNWPARLHIAGTDPLKSKLLPNPKSSSTATSTLLDPCNKIGNQKYGNHDQACVSQKTRKLLGPEDFSGLFSGEFLGSRKAFLNGPENTPDSHPSFSGCFLGFAARTWQWFVKNLNWHGCTELRSSSTLQIMQTFFRRLFRRITGKLLALPFICTVSTPLAVLWLIVIKNVRKVWCKY